VKNAHILCEGDFSKYQIILSLRDTMIGISIKKVSREIPVTQQA
jgi:hypothetical protein